MPADFEDIFSGSDQSFGTWDVRRDKHPARTEQGAPAEKDYSNHLLGKVGLGIVPVRKDGTCRFGAIDIDIDTIDHKMLFSQVENLKLPLSVCRSKSGGAHLYVFVQEPGVQAIRLRSVLSEWSRRLGFGGSEIFPKQNNLQDSNKGNWINLPYFNGETSTRFCYGHDGKVYTFDEFLDHIVFWDGKPIHDIHTPDPATASPKPDDTIFKIFNQGPPCVETMVAKGIAEGSRNVFMFNCAVSAKRADAGTWKEVIVQLNRDKLKPPLDDRELTAIIRSVDGRNYAVRCSEPSLAPFCQFQLCQQRPYGVQYRLETDARSYDVATIRKLRKLNTDPPRYKLEVSSQDVELDTEEFLSYSKLRHRVIELLSIVLPPMKQDRWELQLKQLLDEREDFEAPEEASQSGLVWSRCLEFLSRYKRAKSQEDMLKELPFLQNEYIFFRFSGMSRYLSQFRMDGRPELIYERLKREGGSHKTMRIKGKVMAVWCIPLEALHEQTEDFTKASMPSKVENEI
jgi:hypothetical protein